MDKVIALVKKHSPAVVAEFLGTGVLTIVLLIMSGYAAFPFYIGIAAAVALASVYTMFGGVSGAHVNPAVTFGMWTARKINTVKALFYVAAQFAGALGAWRLFEYIADHKVDQITTEFSTRIWVAEAVGAAVLVMGLASAISRKYDSYQTAVSYGAAFFVGLLISALTLTSATSGYVGYVNPAVALGLRHFDTAYVVGPLVGGLVGANVYMWFFAGEALPKLSLFSSGKKTTVSKTAKASKKPAKKAKRKTTKKK